MNTRGFHAKPLAAGIAAALCLGVATGAYANSAPGIAPRTQTAEAAQSTTQTNTQTTNTTTNEKSEKNKKKRRLTAKQEQIEKLSTITVTGVAGSQLRDLTLKRYAPQIEDSITAINIGQLPNVTISGALARIPGVQISRSGGEGTTVSVDGLPQVQQTLNGELFLSPGGTTNVADDLDSQPDLASGQPDFVDLPATMFSGVDVIKSVMASNISGGVSGIINLRTYRPFDFKPGWTFSGQVQGDTGQYSSKLNKGGSFLASFRNDRWGALLDASYSQERIANEFPRVSAYDGGEEVTEQDVGFDFNGDGKIGNSLDPTVFPKDYFYQWDPTDISTEFSDRKRIGVDGAFQFKISDSLELTADAMYTKYDETDTAYVINTSDNYLPTGLQPGPIKPIITPDGVLLKGINNENSIVDSTTFGKGPSNSLNTNLELHFDNGGLFSGDVRWVHGSAKRFYTVANGSADPMQGSLTPLPPDGELGLTNPNGFPPGIPVLLDFTGKYPSLTVLQNISDLSKWQFGGSAYANRIHANMNVFRADGTLHFDTSILDSFQFGARYQKVNYVFNDYQYLTPDNFGNACASPLGPGPNDALYRYSGIISDCTGFQNYQGMDLSQLPSSWTTFVKDFSPMRISIAGDNHGFPFVNPAIMGNTVDFLRKVFPGATGDPQLYLEPSESWLVTERMKSWYGQFNFSGQIDGVPFLGNVPWRANLGIRWVQTQLSIGSYITNSNIFYGDDGEYDGVLVSQGINRTPSQYSTWLPALNIAFNVTPDQIFRIAVNKTQARQSLPNLGQGLNETYGANGTPPRDPSLPANAQLFVNASQGNPDLKPYRSTNYDLSYAWYFTPQSIAYLSAFLMHVQAFPEYVTLNERLPDADGVVRRSGPVNTIINGGGARIHGLQAEFRTQFTFLPGWLSGFGVNLNYTYLASTNGAASGASDTYNAIVFWQKYGWQVSADYNWSSKVLDFVDSSLSDTLNMYYKPEGYLDASVQYEINKNVSLFLQATNLTNSDDEVYAQYTDAFYQANISGRRYYGGVRVKF